jgi:polar amino acid transport system substrate-binding protein
MKKPLHSIIGIYQNLTRMSLFYYSDPIYIETMRVCVKAGHTFPFSGVVVSGKRVGINRGWRYGEVFDSVRRAGLFEAEEATDNQANLKKFILAAWIALSPMNFPFCRLYTSGVG